MAITCSALLKALAYSGFRPSFTHCVACAEPVQPKDDALWVAFSVNEGGVICHRCERPSDAVNVDANTVKWAEALMRARFDDVTSFQNEEAPLFDILQLIRQWTRAHAGKSLKSVDFLLTCGMF